MTSKKFTLHDRLCIGLEARGNTRVPNDGTRGTHQRRYPFSTKYTLFERANKHGYFYFVGKAGALRTGKTVTKSVPVGENFYASVMAAGLNPGHAAESLMAKEKT